MNRYEATIQWENSNEKFTDNKYSRNHVWRFDGGQEIPASASPHIVPEPYTDSSAVDPEEAFIASLSSCHMLWFLSLAAKRGYRITKYEDQTEGIMKKNKEGKLAITDVILRPAVTFDSDNEPDQKMVDKLHHQAHQRCFIAHSVKTKITIDSQFDAQ